MAEAVLVNPYAIHNDLERHSVEPGWIGVEHETGVPLGYSSGYGTNSSETRTPNIRPKARSRRVSSGSSSEESFSRVPSVRRERESAPSGPGHVQSEQYLLTGQLAPGQAGLPPMGLKRRRGPLHTILKREQGLDENTRRELTCADELLCSRRPSEAIPRLEAAIPGCTDHPQLQSLLWMYLGNANMSAGQFKKASVCYAHHLAYCRELQDAPSGTMAECNLGISYLKQGFLRLAGKCFIQFLGGAQALQDHVLIARAYGNLGMLSKMLAIHRHREHMKEQERAIAKKALEGHLKQAIQYFEHHLEVVEHLEDLEKQARAYGNLGSCYEMLRQFPQAIFCHNKRLEISRTIGNQLSESCALCNLGNCFRATGNIQEAMDYYLLSFELTRAMGNISGEKVAVLNLGTTCEMLNVPKKAIEWHTLYLGMVVQSGDLRGQARGFSTLAGLYEETKQLAKAQEYYRNLVDVFHRMGDGNAEQAAAEYLEEIRESMRQHKTGQNMRQAHRKTGKRVKSQTVSRASGLGSVSRQQPKSSKHKMRTVSSNSSRPWYQTPSESSEGSTPLPSSLILENSMVQSEERFPGLATQADRLYHNAGMSQSLFDHEVLARRHNQDELPSLYSLGDIIGNPCSRTHMPLPEPPSDDSDTDYESVEGESPSPGHLMGNKAHREELRKMSVALVQPSPDLSSDGVDREWEQWLNIQAASDDDVLSRIGSLDLGSPITDWYRPPLPRALSVPVVDQDISSYH